MPRPEPPFISFDEATTILECSKERLRFYIDGRHLVAYVPLPPCFPYRPIYGISPDAEIFSQMTGTRYFWEEQLAHRCRITPPITWRNEKAECGTIIVVTMHGEAPTVTDIKMSDDIGRIGPDGEMFSRILWVFPERDIELKTEEVKRFVVEHGMKASSNKRTERRSSDSPQPRLDALGKVLCQSAGELQQQYGRLPKIDEVLKWLRKFSQENKDHPVIQEVKKREIYWRRGDGKEEKTTYAALQKRLSRIRKIQKISL